MKKPKIGITVGDPAGIGAEIVEKAINCSLVTDICEPVVYGSLKPLKKSLMGRVSAEGGQAAFLAIKSATEDALLGKIDAVATAPVNKESLHAANIPYIGHTEIFAALTNTQDPLTMFETLSLKVFFLTRHVSLRNACDLITEERLVDYLIRCSNHLASQLGIQNPCIAVAGLNPHCGESGLFGNEEQVIFLAIQKARVHGVNAVGPIGADSVFHLAKIGKFDAVLSLYHDQGHIACKTLDFDRTISLTLGMPFLRTSVDHGSAFDIAGKGCASAVSMIEAIRIAALRCTPVRRTPIGCSEKTL
ncbi:MAG: 4-hydroxythreonine-4-phosphate dehydrogenase PdxA [Treponemataceae bacterium]